MGREVSKTRIAALSLGMGRNAGNSVLMWPGGVVGSWIKGHHGSGCGSGKGSMLRTCVPISGTGWVGEKDVYSHLLTASFKSKEDYADLCPESP